MKIVTYNLNGIRAAMNRGFANWLAENDFDIVCIQELKADPSQFDNGVFERLGYHLYWFPAQKKGYSGVAIFSKQKADFIEYGCGNEEFDKEGRVLRCDYGDLSVFSIYFPSGTTGEVRQAVKYVFLDFIFDYLQKIQETRKKMIVCGDYNICHKPIDIHDPVGNKNSSGFLPEERTWLEKFYTAGFVDAFRNFNQEPHQYTWWSYRANARANNKGWRIDHIAVTANLVTQLRSSVIMPLAIHSDHCPVVLELEDFRNLATS
ncbi:MAG: exodeoxyribonuclease III [Chitinophagales bacterium]|nr:exodeoxyribonuclease III [Chitinophagales bacterium]